MPSLIPAVPIGQKPTPASFGGPGTVPGKWWDGLKAYWPMWEGGGANTQDIVQRKWFDHVGSVTHLYSDRGPVLEMASNSDALQTPATDTDYEFSGDPEFTLMCSFRFYGSETDGLMCYRSANNDGMWCWYETSNDSIFFHNDGANQTAVMTDGFSKAPGDIGLNVGDYYRAVLTRSKGGVYRTYINGLFIATATNSATMTTTNAQKMAIGVLQADGANTFQQHALAAGIWDRVLTDAEILALSQDEFAPVRSYIYIPDPVAAAAANGYLAIPAVPVGTKPTPASFAGRASVPGSWWHRLEYCIPAWEDAGVNLMEIVRHDIADPVSTTGGNEIWKPTAHGYAPYYNNNSSGFRYHEIDHYTDLDASIDTEITIAVYLERTNNTARMFPAAMGRISGSTDTKAYFEFHDLDGTHQWKVDGTTAAGSITLSADVEKYETPMILIGVGRPDGTMEVWVDGKSQGTSTFTGNLETGAGSAELGIGSFTGGAGTTYPFYGRIMAEYVWSRALSDSEVQALTADPFAPIRSHVYIPNFAAAGGGGGGIIPLAMYNRRMMGVS